MKERVLRSPVKMIGGKGVLRNRILPYFPKHKIYVEPFGGGANLLLIKKPSKIEVYNDLDPRLVALFECIQSPERLKDLMWLLSLTPYSRKERLTCKAYGTSDDPVETARSFFANSRQSMGGMLDRSSWGMVKSPKGHPVPANVKTINMLPRISERIKDVKLHCMPWDFAIDAYDGTDSLFYLDPPYPKETRRDGWYEFEMSEEEHKTLVRRLLNLKGMAILSGYPTELYDPLNEAGWKVVKFDRSCNSAARTSHTQLQGEGVVKTFQKRTECIWINPAAQVVNEQHGTSEPTEDS